MTDALEETRPDFRASAMSPTATLDTLSFAKFTGRCGKDGPDPIEFPPIALMGCQPDDDAHSLIIRAPAFPAIQKIAIIRNRSGTRLRNPGSKYKFASAC